MRIAIFPGSFDPFTLGHESLVRRGLQLFDRVIVAVGYNEHKEGWIPVDERVRALEEFYRNEPRVEVRKYSGLTVDFARSMKDADVFILRGVRSTKDYEYELNIADVNRRLSGIETVVLFSEPNMACISSSVVRELQHFGRDITEWLPQGLEYKHTH